MESDSILEHFALGLVLIPVGLLAHRPAVEGVIWLGFAIAGSPKASRAPFVGRAKALDAGMRSHGRCDGAMLE